ncbi:MAG TPA: DUF3800 domain-containing protein [Thermoplasmata archaeon]
MQHEHVDIFLDESGDLGFSNPRSSRHLLISTMATPRPQSSRFARLTKKAHRRLKQTGKGAVEFKFNSSSERLRNYFLKGVSETDCWIVWGAVEKVNAKGSLRASPDRLYNNVCGRVMAEMFSHTNAKAIHVVVDRRSGKRTSRESFDHHVENILLSNHSGPFPPEVRISHFDSRRSEGLQVNDFVVGAIFQKVERGNETYYNVIKDKIVGGRVFW